MDAARLKRIHDRYLYGLESPLAKPRDDMYSPAFHHLFPQVEPPAIMSKPGPQRILAHERTSRMQPHFISALDIMDPPLFVPEGDATRNSYYAGRSRSNESLTQ